MQHAPARLGLSPLGTLKLEVFDLKVDAAAADSMSIFGSLRGTIDGERLAGKVVAPSSEWGRGTAQGGVATDVQLLIETSDGALVSIHYNGFSGDGRAVAAFRFHTAAKNYTWLNTVVAVGAGVVDMSGPSIEYDIQVVE